MPLTLGIDVGSSAVKAAVMSVEGDREQLLYTRTDRIRRRNLMPVIQENYEEALKGAGIQAKEINYIATTGEGEMVEFRTGHFYSMTTHARGALYLAPEVRGAIDLGALHTRALRMDGRGKVLQYQMSSQCASGSGQFLENIARYLGVSLDEVGALSQKAEKPEMVSSICAVLSETDVINMVSRGISTANILKGIHVSIATRLVKLLRSIKVENFVAITGGLANDAGMVSTLQAELDRVGTPVHVVAHPNSVYAGAIGAALWGAFRLRKMNFAVDATIAQ
ncbi:MAG TPA: benzoyl-CoA reductase subunit D [Bdellovibrionota bacterium]|nr:benzoyl-CoA reductase subunit D [Bdellovibrionota bacterium]